MERIEQFNLSCRREGTLRLALRPARKKSQRDAMRKPRAERSGVLGLRPKMSKP
jgi:hypothetical protein